MNVLVIGHTYITRIGREKWRALAATPDIRLRIVVPTEWRDYLFTLRYDEHRDEELDMHALPVWFSGKEGAHLYRSLSLGMHGFRPDILHVEEGTDAASYAQALTLARVRAPRARTVFFTWMNFEKRLRFPFGAIERYNLARSDAAICGNADARDILRRKGFTRPVHVMPLLGVDTELFSPGDGAQVRRELGLEGRTIGFVGRFVPEKGILDLMEAIAPLPGSWTLLCVGGGALRDEMQARAAALGIASRLRVVTDARHADVPRYLRAMDALVLPSYTVPHWKEQFGQVLAQAMACEIPVIGSRHAEIPNVIGDAGMLFDERDVEELRNCLRTVIEDDALRRTLGAAGRERVLARYTNTVIAERTLEVYRSLMR